MKLSFQYIILGLSLLVCFGFIILRTTPLYFAIPKGFPKPVYNFKNNPLTEEGFQLGRKLFYDPILSRDSTISCASCHLQGTGFTHIDHDLSHGIEGKIGTRNSLTLQNLAWTTNFMWDGGVNHLDVQAIAPITSEVEMDENLQNVVAKLSKNQKYRDLFLDAFQTQEITGQLILKAISQFVVSLTTSNSKYDKVMRKKEKFTAKERNGYNLFKKNCASCHQEPLFTNPSFKNNGLPVDPTLNDFGRFKITQNPSDSLKFKVPTLRNIQYTFPYMHDGRFKTLTQVVKHYNSLVYNKKIAPELAKPMNLSDDERLDLVLFLITLTDKDFLQNKRYGFPSE